MKKILTLTDFSEAAEQAVEASFQLAQLYNADLHMFHCFTDDEFVKITYGHPLNINFSNELKDDITSKINHWNEWSQKLEVFTKFHFVAGDFISKLKNHVDKTNPDLIILGSKGKSNKSSSYWGSNTQSVIDTFDRPVLVIKEPMQDYHLDNIVFASSFDEDQQAEFEYFIKLINPPKEAVIHLVCVDTLGYFSQPSSAIKESMGKFSELAAPYQTKSYFYKDYSIEAGIRHIMEELKPDLLVMPNKKDKPLKHLIQGNNALKLAHLSDFPVLVIDYKDKQSK